MAGESSLVASVPAAGSDVFTWTVENGTLTAGQGTSSILFAAGLPGTTTLRVVQKTVNGCPSEAGVLVIPVEGFSATRIVPVVVSVAGSGGAQFSSELTLSNPGGSSAHVELTLTPADALGGGASSTVSQDIGPGRQLVIPDALAFFAQQGAARTTLAAAASGGGSVRSSFTNLPAKAIVFVGARTTALSGPGRAGLSYPAPAAEKLFDGRVAVYGLRETAAERTNLALENAGTSGPIDLRVTLVSGAGDARFVLPRRSPCNRVSGSRSVPSSTRPDTRAAGRSSSACPERTRSTRTASRTTTSRTTALSSPRFGRAAALGSRRPRDRRDGRLRHGARAREPGDRGRDGHLEFHRIARESCRKLDRLRDVDAQAGRAAVRSGRRRLPPLPRSVRGAERSGVRRARSSSGSRPAGPRPTGTWRPEPRRRRRAAGATACPIPA